jgi:hypothetical protein
MEEARDLETNARAIVMLNVRTILVQYPEGVRVVFFFCKGKLPTASGRREPLLAALWVLVLALGPAFL